MSTSESSWAGVVAKEYGKGLVIWLLRQCSYKCPPGSLSPRGHPWPSCSTLEKLKRSRQVDKKKPWVQLSPGAKRYVKQPPSPEFKQCKEGTNFAMLWLTSGLTDTKTIAMVLWTAEGRGGHTQKCSGFLLVLEVTIFGAGSRRKEWTEFTSLQGKRLNLCLWLQKYC